MGANPYEYEQSKGGYLLLLLRMRSAQKSDPVSSRNRSSTRSYGPSTIRNNSTLSYCNLVVYCVFQGKVPRNEYGNVELFQPCMLPPGTKHIQSKFFLIFFFFYVIKTVCIVSVSVSEAAWPCG